jgi:hypothetical protein
MLVLLEVFGIAFFLLNIGYINVERHVENRHDNPPGLARVGVP